MSHPNSLQKGRTPSLRLSGRSGRPGSQGGCGWGQPATTWRDSANRRADRTLRLGFKQTTESSSGGGRSGSGQAAQLREGSRRAAARRHPARARPAATMPKRKVSSAEGAAKGGVRARPPAGGGGARGPRGGRRGCPRSPRPRKWKRSPRRRQQRINLQTKKCKQRGKEEQRENRLKWLTKKQKKTYLQKTEKLKMRVQHRMKQERKKPSLISITYHVLSVVPVSLLVQSRGIFLSTIL
ncbi:non-histone chromosomal protein HMG-14 [Mustela nigripes]|uniref:non-histone chromosomal protein HMG-14 n=1 Tax=Mustela nigripes TaxID=77151 RepID=UPI002815975D|nr:non-histone chromosomal protein HMG-14 [Mustela nigripes]